MSLFGLIALTISAAFTGAAIYINIAEQPARLMMDDAALLREWKPSYKRGFAMQASLAVLGFVFGLLAWTQTGETRFLYGALILVANWPWTLLAIMPTNNKLMAMEPSDNDPQIRVLVRRWGWLHAVRSGLGFLATVLFFLSLIGH
jgi:Anthrone oxygenase